jgi:hypothetical protein
MVDIVAQPSRIGGSYVEWGAVIAGAVLAAGISFVLLTFGAAIGLSLISPYAFQSYGRGAASVAVLWGLIVPIFSLLIGGYVTGRLRVSWDTADEAEVEFRDGIHGALVWGVSIVIGGLLAFFAATAAAQTGAGIGNTTADRSALFAPAADSLFNPVNVADATSTAPPAATTSPAKPTATGASAALARTGTDERESATRVLSSAVAAGHLSIADRNYLTGVVSQRTGLSASDAEKRVDQAYAQALDAADKARKSAVVAALVTATGLFLGLAAAWYGAQRGGHHRDEKIPARFTWSLRPRPKNVPSV